jgi:heme exporter protein A
VLAHVELRLAAGDALLVAGANGSGKTTLLRLLAGRLAASAGSVRLFGLDPQRHGGAVRRELSMVSHSLSLYPRLTGAETLALWLRLGGEEAAPARVADLLAAAGLAGHGGVEVGSYSAGMRKRLALVRVRVERPRLLLLDEPFSSLDAAGRAWLAGWLRELRGEGVGLILASHTLEQAATLCDQAVRLSDGQIAWRGPATSLAEAAG